MKLWPYVGVICIFAVPALQQHFEDDGVPDDLKKVLRDTVARGYQNTKNNAKFFKFVEDKLLQHTQALELLVKVTQNIEELTLALVDNLSVLQTLQKPKAPETIEVNPPSRRKQSQKESPIAKLRNNIPKFGVLFRDLLASDNKKDAMPVIEDIDDKTSDTKLNTRRSYTRNYGYKKNPWCVASLLCIKTNWSVCGFDDSYGYARFDNQCHMLQYNCYWNMNYFLTTCPY